MTPDEYKNQLTLLTFPSGLQLAIKPPSVAKLMTLQRTILGAKVTEGKYMDFLAQVVMEVSQGFPDTFTVYHYYGGLRVDRITLEFLYFCLQPKIRTILEVFLW